MKVPFQRRCVDLFAGAGGLSFGFAQAGFDVIAANDFDPVACETLSANHPGTKVLCGPIQKFSANDFLPDGEDEIDCLIGGPPCQAFSVYNHQRGMHDARSSLFREYLRLVEGLRPKIVVMENVTGITSIANGKAVREIHQRLGELGYHVEHRILKAEEYGVPQERRRIVFIGTKMGQHVSWPKQTHFAPGQIPFGPPFITIWDAISDLPPLEISGGADTQPYAGPPLSKYQKMMRQGSAELYNHVAPFLSEINRERLKFIPEGGSWRDIPIDLLPSGMKRAKRSDHTKRYGRPKKNDLACTILTKCDLHWGAYIHPEQDRTLTVREAARLQSFPDSFRFLGSRGDQFRQVGNAVPPLLAQAIAVAVLGMLDEVGRQPRVSRTSVGKPRAVATA
jgi:DNA (cytosine-5)-methyltransferase 1